MKKWEKGLSQRSHEDRGAGRRCPRHEGGAQRTARCRIKKTPEQREVAYALKKFRETAAERTKVIASLKARGKGLLPRVLFPESQLYKPCVAIRHTGACVILGETVACAGTGPRYVVVIRIMKVLGILNPRGRGRQPVHVGKCFAVPGRDAYRVPLSVARREGVTWRD